MADEPLPTSQVPNRISEKAPNLKAERKTSGLSRAYFSLNAKSNSGPWIEFSGSL